MGRVSRPRTGSLQFYPHSRAQKETPSFRGFELDSGGKAKAANFFGFKAGMIQAGGKDLRKGTPSSGHDIVFAATVIECPPLRVFGIRALGKNPDKNVETVLLDVTSEKTDRHLLKKQHSFKQKHSKKKKEAIAHKTVTDLEKLKNQIKSIRLLVHTQPALTGFGKKKPDVSEIALSGSIDDQLAFAKEKLGHEIKVSDVFEPHTLLDVKAVSKGKGMQGVIKRHNVKIQRHKAKKLRVVGSIGPWHPPTVMWTVGRPGQMGYNSRTEFNKKILEIGSKGQAVSPKAGFLHYGAVANDFVLVAGSVPGPAKRVIALRRAIRPMRENRLKLESLSFVSTRTEGSASSEEAPRAMKMEAAKEEKTHHKSVEEELAEAGKNKSK